MSYDQKLLEPTRVRTRLRILPKKCSRLLALANSSRCGCRWKGAAVTRSRTDAERTLISAMITSAKATDPDRLKGSVAWRNWRHELHEMIDRLSVGKLCDCGKCPSFQLLVDGHEVPSSPEPIILEAFISE